MDFCKSLSAIFSRSSPEVLIPAQDKVLQSQLDRICQADGCYLLDLDVRRCRDGSLLISSPHPFRTVIGLPGKSNGNIADIICRAAEISADLKANLKSTAYILDIRARNVIKKEDKDIAIDIGKDYKILVVPIGVAPDFDALLAKATHQPAAPKP